MHGRDIIGGNVVLTAHLPKVIEHGLCLRGPAAPAITVAQRRQQMPQKSAATEQRACLQANLDRLVVTALSGMSPCQSNIRASKRGMQVQRPVACVDGFRITPPPVEDEPEIAGDGGGKRLQTLGLPQGSQSIFVDAHDIAEYRHPVPGLSVVRVDPKSQSPFTVGSFGVMVKGHQYGGYCGVRCSKTRIER